MVFEGAGGHTGNNDGKAALAEVVDVVDAGGVETARADRGAMSPHHPPKGCRTCSGSAADERRRAMLFSIDGPTMIAAATSLDDATGSDIEDPLIQAIRRPCGSTTRWTS